MNVKINTSEFPSTLDMSVTLEYVRGWNSSRTFSMVLDFIQKHKLGKKSVQLSNIDILLSTNFFKESRRVSDDIDTRPYRVVDAVVSSNVMMIGFTYYDEQ